MGGKKELFKEEGIGPVTPICTITEPSYTSQDGVEYTLTTDYFYHAASHQVIQKVFSTCKNPNNPAESWKNRFYSEKIVDLMTVPEGVRHRIQALDLKIK